MPPSRPLSYSEAAPASTFSVQEDERLKKVKISKRLSRVTCILKFPAFGVTLRAHTCTRSPRAARSPPWRTLCHEPAVSGKPSREPCVCPGGRRLFSEGNLGGRGAQGKGTGLHPSSSEPSSRPLGWASQAQTGKLTLLPSGVTLQGEAQT